MSTIRGDHRRAHVPHVGHNPPPRLYDTFHGLAGLGSYHRRLVEQADVRAGPGDRVRHREPGGPRRAPAPRRGGRRVGCRPEGARPSPAQSRTGGFLRAIRVRSRAGSPASGRLVRRGTLRIHVPPPRDGGEEENAARGTVGARTRWLPAFAGLRSCSRGLRDRERDEP